MHDSPDVHEQLAHLQNRLAELELGLVRERTSWREPLERLNMTLAEQRDALRQEIAEVGAQFRLLHTQLQSAESQLAARTEEALQLRLKLEEFSDLSRAQQSEQAQALERTRRELAELHSSSLQDLSELDARLESQHEVLTEGLSASLEASSTRMDAILELRQALEALQETQARDRARVQEHLGALTRWLKERDEATRKRLANLEDFTRGVHRGLTTLQDSVRHDFQMLNETLTQLALQEQLLAQALDAVQQSDMNAELQTSTWIQDQLGGLRQAIQSAEREGETRRTELEALRHAHELTARQVESLVRMISKASRPEFGS